MKGTPIKLYLARHTQSEYNVKQLLNSDPSVDVRLTSKGLAQAHELAQKLAGEQFEVIYTSELLRTTQTAKIVNQNHHVPVIADRRLNDNASGFEGQPARIFLDALAAQPDKWRAVFNDGESLERARDRAADFLQDLAKRDYKAVLIITHGYILECIYGIVNKLSYEGAAAFQPAQGDYFTLGLPKSGKNLH